MIERHITFNVLPGRGEVFERYFAEAYRPAASASPGLVRLDLLRESGDPSRYQMVFRWADEDAAVGWRTSETHVALQPALEALHGGMEVTPYVVVA